MESLDDKIRRYRDETFLELEALERRAAALRIAIKAFDDLLNWETEHPPERRSEIASEAAVTKWKDRASPTDLKVIAACFNWSTVREIAVSAPYFRIRSLANISTKCASLWRHGYLERRKRLSFGGLCQAGYEYKALNPIKVS